MITLDVVVAFGLLGLLRHVNRRLAVTATVLRLIQGAIIVLNLNYLIRALAFAFDAEGADGVIIAGPAQDALDAVERHALGYDAGLIAFGLSCLVLARLLIARRTGTPAARLGHGCDGRHLPRRFVRSAVRSSASSFIEPFYVICLVVELTFAIRLVTRGLATPTRTATRRPVTVAA